MMSKLQWTQIKTMVRYELLMSWRRGSLKAILVMMIVLPFSFNLLTPFVRNMVTDGLELWPDEAITIQTGAAVALNSFMVVMMVFILPMVVAEVFPLDQQYKVRSLLDTLPISASTYTAGKLLGPWLIILLSGSLIGVINGWIAWSSIGPFHARILLSFWLIGLLTLGFFTTGFSIMLASLTTNRKQAVLIGLMSVLIGIAGMALLPTGEYLWNSLLLTSLTAVGTPRQVVQAAQFPRIFLPNYLLRIGLVIASITGLWLWTVYRIRKARNEI